LTKTARYILGGLLAAAGAYIVVTAFQSPREEPDVAPAVLTQAWVTNQLGAGALVFETPWKLEANSLDLPSQVLAETTRVEALKHKAQGLQIGGNYMAIKGGRSANLEAAAKGSMDNVRAMPGTLSVESKRQAVKVGGQPALELNGVVNRRGAEALTIRSLFIVRGHELFHIMMVYSRDLPRGDQIWARCRKSVKFVSNK
jgi:hypothetical protein